MEVVVEEALLASERLSAAVMEGNGRATAAVNVPVVLEVVLIVMVAVVVAVVLVVIVVVVVVVAQQ